MVLQSNKWPDMMYCIYCIRDVLVLTNLGVTRLSKNYDKKKNTDQKTEKKEDSE